MIMESKELNTQIEEEIKQFSKTCIIRPSVAVITIGSDPINKKFIKSKEDACNRVGIYFRYHNFEDNTPELTIINKIKELNNDDYVNGIMISLPIPEKYNEKRLLNTIINSKDIDGLTDINIGRLISGRKTIMPCAVQGIMELFKHYNVDLEGKEVVIVGNSKLIGRPITNILLNEGATVTVCNSKTKDLKKHTLEADIIISTAGVKHIIKQDMVKEGAVVIDAGYSLENGKLYGDVDFDKVKEKASLITPATGGVGAMTVSIFLKNTIFCYNNKK